MADETGRMSEEDKFLGVRTTIEPPSDTSTSAQADEVDVEVVDDRPAIDQRSASTATSEDEDIATDAEIESYGKRAYKRMKKLKWQYHEERRAKEQSDRLANEAVTYTGTLQTENQRLLKLVQDSQKALTEHSRYGAQIAVQAAQKNLKEAHESGDAEQIAQSQQALTQAQLAQASAPAVSQRIIENWKQNVLAEQRQQAQQQPALAPQVTEPDPEAQEWQEKNPWFGQDTEMTSFAYGVHERLVRDEGVDPESSKYYQLIDNRMREVFPSYFGTSEVSSTEPIVVESAPRRRTSPVVAPATRNNGAAPRKVTLTSTQVALAKRLGITPQQYASQLIKEMV
jgi:hypothetical protein